MRMLDDSQVIDSIYIEVNHASSIQKDCGLPLPPLVPAFPTPSGHNDWAAQREWEHHQVERGIQRYRDSLVRVSEDGAIKRKGLDETEPGQVIAKDVLGPLVATLKTRQAEAAAYAIESSVKSKMSEDDWVLLALPAETLAACTVLTALTKCDPATWTSTARDVGTRVQHELEFVTWRNAERRAAKERKEAGAEPQVDLFRLMHDRNDVIDQRVFKKWSVKAPLFTKGDWEPATKLRVGSMLLTHLIEGGAWFEIATKQEGPKTTRIFQLTALGREFVAHRHQQNELMRPYLLPMICEPRDYEYL